MSDLPPAAGWVLHSSTNNRVYTDGARWLKVPDPSNPSAHTDLDVEARAWALLGVPVERDGSALVLPHLVGPVPTLTEDVAGVMAVHVQALAALPAPDGAPILYRRAARRVLERNTPGVFGFLSDAPPTLTGDRLVHGDPRVENWVVDGDGALVLLDWESAVASCADAALGVLWVSLAARDPDAAEVVAARPRMSASGFRHGAWCKLALSTSWLAWRPTAADDLIRRNLVRAVRGCSAFTKSEADRFADLVGGL